jgi:DNA mismatch endonuclease (patch repair protein)
MADPMTPAQRSLAMKRVKLKGGPLELAVCQALSRHGIRFRRNCRELHGSPDVVLSKCKVAIFVDGDFWHAWRLPAWEHKLTEFWRVKLHANRKRDQRNFRRLRAEGWTVIRLWEHQILRDLPKCTERIIRAVSEQRG